MPLSRSFLASALLALTASGALAQGGYNRPPADDAVYGMCLAHSARVYEGGNAPSPLRGQTKAQAWCTCMWNETPEDFKGNLVKFSETCKDKETNALCGKHADW
jgi:hypothetical protein